LLVWVYLHRFVSRLRLTLRLHAIGRLLASQYRPLVAYIFSEVAVVNRDVCMESRRYLDQLQLTGKRYRGMQLCKETKAESNCNGPLKILCSIEYCPRQQSITELCVWNASSDLRDLSRAQRSCQRELTLERVLCTLTCS
jgi:hypothetical protein